MFKTIVVAVDGSAPSERALIAACALAKTFEGEVHLVQALENASPEPPADGTYKTAVMGKATATAQSQGVTPASATVGEGDAFEEIMTIAQLYGADLIVTGRRGLGNIGGLFAGSTSQQIAKSASCAFLSVK